MSKIPQVAVQAFCAVVCVQCVFACGIEVNRECVIHQRLRVGVCARGWVIGEVQCGVARCAQERLRDFGRIESTAIAFIADPRDQARLKRRVTALRQQILRTLEDRARVTGAEQPKVRARIAFGLLGELTSATYYESELSGEHARLAQELLMLALTSFGRVEAQPSER